MSDSPVDPKFQQLFNVSSWMVVLFVITHLLEGDLEMKILTPQLNVLLSDIWKPSNPPKNASYLKSYAAILGCRRSCRVSRPRCPGLMIISEPALQLATQMLSLELESQAVICNLGSVS